ncbi:MAG: NDP-sugar synthase [Chlorobium sp.]|uniref:NDP-sugar synthase n=1 Tax=Chlorobium sp. TaxID=1095 RepID=UPI0025C19E59|nr:NDP-sugar synthase [Chlorobium sp.]MCF8383063.1 NDP-sugar synthase [Chlorobium sp.]
MKTLIAIKEQYHTWVHEAFPAMHPLLLPLCNKPFIEYLIDFAILAGSREVRLLSDGQLTEVEEHCGTGSRWGIELSYANLHPADDQQQLLDKNRKFCGGGRTMILTGYNFISYNKQKSYLDLATIATDTPIASCPGGTITLKGPPESGASEKSPLAPFSITPLDSVQSYFRISMETLQTGSSRYVLPGYGSEPDCSIGKNVIISKTAQIRKPVSIGDNVQILPKTIIGPSAIIGSNVVIDNGCSVSGSIIIDNTYIGENLEIDMRIAAGNTLIDPTSGVSLTMEDPHLLVGIKTWATTAILKRKTIHALAATILLVLQFIPFILLFPLLKLQGKWKDDPYMQETGLAGALAVAISLDRFPLLLKVITGKLDIIGSSSRSTCAGKHSYPDSGPLSRLAVFSYAEAEDWPVNGSDAAIVERFHAVHSTPIKDIGMTIKALINRLTKGR